MLHDTARHCEGFRLQGLRFRLSLLRLPEVNLGKKEAPARLRLPVDTLFAKINVTFNHALNTENDR